MRKWIAMLLCAALTLGGAIAETDWGAAARELTDALLSGDYEAVAARFDEDMASQLDAAALRQTCEAVLPGMGARVGGAGAETARADGHTVAVITEEFEAGELTFQFVFDGEGRVAGLGMKPVMKPVSEEGPWVEHEITVQADPAYPLGATLCLPEGGDEAPPPVVILAHGSGSSDRDEAAYQKRPFMDIAHGLAELGVASLRYDKRTFVYPEAAGESGMDIDLRGELLDDVNACIELMRKDGRVDGARIFVLGHSLGGMMLPAIAAENPDLAGAISMAGSLRPLWEIVYDQNVEAAARLRAAGLSEEQRAQLDAQMESVEADIARLRGGVSGIADGEILLGVPAAYWKSLDAYAGMKFVDALSVPMLVLQGSEDFQVYADVDYPLWREALEGHADAEFVLYEGLNHMMCPSSGIRSVEDYLTPGGVREDVIADIAAFVQAR